MVAYCDINHFKPFNDAFGYSAGDEVIVNLGRILCAAVDNQQDFVGHVGGDDFILVFCGSNWQQRCEQILANFSQMSAALMPPETPDYWSTDRQGRRQKFGALTLAIGAVEPDLDYCKTHHHISQLLADAKQSAKQEGGNNLFLSRRRQPSLVHNV